MIHELSNRSSFYEGILIRIIKSGDSSMHQCSSSSAAHSVEPEPDIKGKTTNWFNSERVKESVAAIFCEPRFVSVVSDDGRSITVTSKLDAAQIISARGLLHKNRFSGKTDSQ